MSFLGGYDKGFYGNNSIYFINYSNLFTPKYSKDFKFTELADLPSIHCKSQQEEEKSSETVAVTSGICDSVKNSQPYRELDSTLNIVTYDNIDALVMIKEKLNSENIEEEINSDLLEKIVNLKMKEETAKV